MPGRLHGELEENLQKQKMKPMIHAESSAKKWGGEPEEYFEIHDFMDCSKGAFPTNGHRALTHNAWFIKNVLERVKFTNSCEPIGNSFPYIILKNGRKVSVRDIGEQHILEDFGNRFLPSAQDYLGFMQYQPWMGNERGSLPPSFQNTIPKQTEKVDVVFKPAPPAGPMVFDGNMGGRQWGERIVLDGLGPSLLERKKRELEAKVKDLPKPCGEIVMPGEPQECVLQTEITIAENLGELTFWHHGMDSEDPRLRMIADGSGVPAVAEYNRNLMKD